MLLLTENHIEDLTVLVLNLVILLSMPKVKKFVIAVIKDVGRLMHR